MKPPSSLAHRARAGAFASIATLVFAAFARCGAPTKSSTSPTSPASPREVAPAASESPVVEFALHPLCDEPCDDRETQGESRSLRGKRALVIVGTSYDSDTLLNLRELAPLLTQLPVDTQCLFVAKQPWSDRAIVKYFFEYIHAPCRIAIADETEHRLGDLEKLETIPVLFLLTPEGRLAWAVAGRVRVEQVRGLLLKQGHSPSGRD